MCLRKRLYIVFIFSLLGVLRVNAQLFSKHQIDSLNALAYHVKTSKATYYIDVYKHVVEASEKIKYSLGEAAANENLGLLYTYEGDFKQATVHNIEAIKTYENLNNKERLAAALGSYGYQLKRRNLPQAVQYMQKGIAIAEDVHAEQELLRLYDNYGVLKEMKEELDSALYFYQESLHLKEKHGDTVGIPYSLNKIGIVQVYKGDLGKAKTNFENALAIRERIQDSIGIAESMSFLGSYYVEEGDTTQALSFFEKSLGISQKLHYNFLTQDNYKQLATLHENRGDYSQALQYYKHHTTLQDSLSNIDLRKKQAELDTQFETEQKEKEILLQKIKLVEKNNHVVLALALLMLSILLGYFFYNKQKTKAIQLEKENALKDALLKIETQNKLQEQRLQISRDLHDNIGAQLTFIISSIDNLKFAYTKEQPVLEQKLNRISVFTKDTIYELRDTIWAMNKEEITVEDLKTRISNFIDNAQLSQNGIVFQFDVHDNLGNSIAFSSKVGMNIYRILQEGVNNAVKHAQATKIEVSITITQHYFSLHIKDNGSGFVQQETTGNGMLNMKKRANEIAADFTIHSSESGLLLVLKVPKASIN